MRTFKIFNHWLIISFRLQFLSQEEFTRRCRNLLDALNPDKEYCALCDELCDIETLAWIEFPEPVCPHCNAQLQTSAEDLAAIEEALA